MALDFGMKFKKRNGLWLTESLPQIAGASYQIEVAEESLHLLEPQVGDILRGDEHNVPSIRFMDVPDAEQMGAGAAMMRRGFKIIQRNGIPFHWPEVEP